MNTFFTQFTKVVFLIGLLLFSEQISAQRRPGNMGTTRPTRPSRQVEKSYKIDEILIMKPGDLSKGIASEDSGEKLINLLGNPTNIEEFYNEVYEANEKIYCYNNNKIYVRQL